MIRLISTFLFVGSSYREIAEQLSNDVSNRAAEQAGEIQDLAKYKGTCYYSFQRRIVIAIGLMFLEVLRVLMEN